MKNKRHRIIKWYYIFWYYIFWSVCAVAVVSGQIYVGTGYRQMVETLKSIQISTDCKENAL